MIGSSGGRQEAEELAQAELDGSAHGNLLFAGGMQGRHAADGAAEDRPDRQGHDDPDDAVHRVHAQQPDQPPTQQDHPTQQAHAFGVVGAGVKVGGIAQHAGAVGWRHHAALGRHQARHAGEDVAAAGGRDAIGNAELAPIRQAASDAPAIEFIQRLPVGDISPQQGRLFLAAVTLDLLQGFAPLFAFMWGLGLEAIELLRRLGQAGLVLAGELGGELGGAGGEAIGANHRPGVAKFAVARHHGLQLGGAVPFQPGGLALFEGVCAGGLPKHPGLVLVRPAVGGDGPERVHHHAQQEGQQDGCHAQHELARVDGHLKALENRAEGKDLAPTDTPNGLLIIRHDKSFLAGRAGTSVNGARPATSRMCLSRRGLYPALAARNRGSIDGKKLVCLHRVGKIDIGFSSAVHVARVLGRAFGGQGGCTEHFFEIISLPRPRNADHIVKRNRGVPWNRCAFHARRARPL